MKWIPYNENHGLINDQEVLISGWADHQPGPKRWKGVAVFCDGLFFDIEEGYEYNTPTHFCLIEEIPE